MNRKLFIGIIILGIAVTIFAPMVIGGLSIAVWIYLAWMVWKSKTSISHDQVEPRLAQKRLRRLKTLLIVAGVSFLISIAGIVVHNVRYGLSEKEEPVSFFVGLVALWVFVIATAGGLVIFLKERGRST